MRAEVNSRDAAAGSASGSFPRGPGFFVSRGRVLVIRICAMVVLVGASIPFGSRDPFWPAVFMWPLAGCALALSFERLVPQERRLVGLVVLVLTAAAIVLAFQSGLFHAPALSVWAQTGLVLGEKLRGLPRLSAEPPLAEIALCLVLPLALFAGLALGRTLRRSRGFLTLVVHGGALFAVLWILLFLASPDHVLWRLKMGHEGNLTGTFTNRNTAAAFLAVPFVIGQLLIADFLDRHYLSRGISGRTLLSLLLRRSPRRFLVLAAEVLVLATALAMTASRAGAVLAILAGLATAIWRFRRHLRSGAAKGAILAMVAATFALASVFFAEGLSQRFTDSSNVDLDRFEAYAAMIGTIRDHPWLGTGFGSFQDIFQAYRPSGIPARGVWETAHNTYLQVMIEAGVPFFLVSLLPLVYVLAVFARSMWVQGPERLAPIAGFFVLAMPAAHALIDFPVQIPGYSMPLLVVVGALFSMAVRPNGKTIVNEPRFAVNRACEVDDVAPREGAC